MAPNSCYRHLTLYSSSQSYTFVPTDVTDQRSLSISRLTGEVKLNSQHSSVPIIYDTRKTTVYGIFGIASLALTDYVIIITGRAYKATFMGHDIFLATKYELLPVNSNIIPSHHPSEHYLTTLLESHLNSGTFWFSYDWDLTRRLQAQGDDEGKALWEAADDRFFWNKYLQSRLIDITSNNQDRNLSPYILPVVYGTFDLRDCELNNRRMQFCLISRRSRFRAGTRYFRRGADHEGNVANFNETEQIVILDRLGKPPGDMGIRLSFVQIRGSVPLYWAEINNLRYKPDLTIMDRPDSDEAMRLHFQSLSNIYGEQNIVSLVNQKGHEQPLKEAFEDHISKLRLPKVKYEYFDFHRECRKMRWDRISLLLDRLEEDLLREGYFYYDVGRPEPIKLQQGVVRTNCMDNLDRTNVAQSAIAKWMLDRQLRDVGVFQEHETIETHETFMNHFRNIWADHADAISKAYSGTGALKTDFTRTGKRTRVGLLEDGANSVMRYLKNNFLDGPRQDGFDLVTGAWNPKSGSAAAASLWIDTRPLIIRSMPHVASLSLFMVLAGLTLPRTSDYSLKYWFWLWVSLLMLSVAFIIAHGLDYVSWPRLIALDDIIHYDGPGFRAGYHGKGFFSTGQSGHGTNRTIGRFIDNDHEKKGVLNEIEMGTKKRVD